MAGRFQRLRTAWSAPQEQVKSLALDNRLSSILGVGTGASAHTAAGALRIYDDSTIASVPINWIAESLAVVEPVLFKGTEMITDHPVLDLLKAPSPWFTQELFIETVAKHYLITGESPIVALGVASRPPAELQPLSPSVVQPTRGPDGLPGQYLVSSQIMPGAYLPERVRSEVRFYSGPLRELKVIRSFSIRDSSSLRGESPMVPAADEARQHILGNQHNVSMLERGGKVSLLFHFKNDLDDKTFVPLRERIHEAYGGPSKAGGIAVTSGADLEMKELGLSARDMDWKNIMDTARMAFALQYRVPLPLVFMDASTFNNYENAKLALWDDAILPLSRVIFGGLSDLLLPRYGEDPTKMRLGLDPESITPLVNRRLDELTKRRAINIETDDELRNRAGLEDYVENDQPGGQIRVASSTVPLGSDLFTDLQDPELGDEGDPPPPEPPEPPEDAEPAEDEDDG